MSYLKRRRARIILRAFVISSLLFVAFPGIDLFISGLFFDQGFYLAKENWTQLLHEAVGPSIVVAMVSIFALYAFNRIARRDIAAIDGKKVLYLFLVLALGAGLIVNATFKDNFGRARPRDTEQFGGGRQFTPAFVIADGCKSNCSFSSGDAAGAFFSLALVMAFTRRRRAQVAAIAVGCVVSFSRIAIGAHYLSDTVVSFFVMLIVADVLYHYVLLARGDVVEPERTPERVMHPATATLSTVAER